MTQTKAPSSLLTPRWRTHRGPLVFSTTETNYGCEQSAYWSLQEGLGLENPKPAIATSLGSLVHATFADWGALYAAHHLPVGTAIFESGGDMRITKKEEWAQSYEPDPTKIFERHFESFKVNTYKRYEARTGSEMDDEEWEPYEKEVGDLGQAMVSNYYLHYGTP